jgi:hypothetical protein
VTGGRARGDLAAQVGEVGRRERRDEQLLDDGQEVVERADRPEGQGVGRASGAAGRGQPEGHFHPNS